MRIFRKILKILIITLISIVATTLSLVGLYYLFTGGIEAIEQSIKNDGLWNSIVNFFKAFWTGFKQTLGF